MTTTAVYSPHPNPLPGGARGLLSARINLWGTLSPVGEGLWVRAPSLNKRYPLPVGEGLGVRAPDLNKRYPLPVGEGLGVRAPDRTVRSPEKPIPNHI